MRARQAARLAEEAEQAERCHVGIQRPVFGKIAEALRRANPVPAHFDPGDACLTGTGREVAGKDLHRCGFPGAVRAEKCRHLALRHTKRDVANGGEIFVELGEANGLNHGDTADTAFRHLRSAGLRRTNYYLSIERRATSPNALWRTPVSAPDRFPCPRESNTVRDPSPLFRECKAGRASNRRARAP